MQSANRIMASGRQTPSGTGAGTLERRRHFRVAGEWSVRVRIGPDVAVDATAVDISLGGILLSVSAPVAIVKGRVLDLCLPDEIGWVEARVSRVHDRDGDDEARWGLELGEMEPSVRAAWARHVFTEARRRGYQEEVDAWAEQARSSSLLCPTCGNLMNATIAPERLVTATQLAESLDVRVGMVYRMARRGVLPCYRIGRRVRFDLAEVRQVLRPEGGAS